MAATPVNIKVNLTNPVSGHAGAHETLKVQGRKDEMMEITFERTIRVPDNSKAYDLPPSMGAFPIYSIRQFEGKLSDDMTGKGGLLLPIYQREAMWINFHAANTFALRIYVGGVNAVSGKAQGQPRATTIQDDIVPGAQEWLDGIVASDGEVKQFVAVPTNTGYSVEAQITGKDSIAGVQIEIIPSKKPVEYYSITTKSLTGATNILNVQFNHLVRDVKGLLQDKARIPPDQQRFVFGGQEIKNDRALKYYNVKNDGFFHLCLRLREDGTGPPPSASVLEMAIAAGGIKQRVVQDPFGDTSQNWDFDNSAALNLQLFNAGNCKQVLGINPPPTPISANTYADYGYPFYKLYEEPSGIFGNFPVQTVATLDRNKSLNTDIHKSEEDLKFPSIKLGLKDRTNVFLSKVDAFWGDLSPKN